MPYIKGIKIKLSKALCFKKEKNKETPSTEPYSPEAAIRYYDRLVEYKDN